MSSLDFAFCRAGVHGLRACIRVSAGGTEDAWSGCVEAGQCIERRSVTLVERRAEIEKELAAAAGRGRAGTHRQVPDSGGCDTEPGDRTRVAARAHRGGIAGPARHRAGDRRRAREPCRCRRGIGGLERPRSARPLHVDAGGPRVRPVRCGTDAAALVPVGGRAAAARAAARRSPAEGEPGPRTTGVEKAADGVARRWNWRGCAPGVSAKTLQLLQLAGRIEHRTDRRPTQARVQSCWSGRRLPVRPTTASASRNSSACSRSCRRSRLALDRRIEEDKHARSRATGRTRAGTAAHSRRCRPCHRPSTRYVVTPSCRRDWKSAEHDAGGACAPS